MKNPAKALQRIGCRTEIRIAGGDCAAGRRWLMVLVFESGERGFGERHSDDGKSSCRTGCRYHVGQRSAGCNSESEIRFASFAAGMETNRNLVNSKNLRSENKESDSPAAAFSKAQMNAI